MTNRLLRVKKTETNASVDANVANKLMVIVEIFHASNVNDHSSDHTPDFGTRPRLARAL